MKRAATRPYALGDFEVPQGEVIRAFRGGASHIVSREGDQTFASASAGEDGKEARTASLRGPNCYQKSTQVR